MKQDATTYEDGAGNRYFVAEQSKGGSIVHVICKRPFGSKRVVAIEEIEPALFSVDAQAKLDEMAKEQGWEVYEPYTKPAVPHG